MRPSVLRICKGVSQNVLLAFEPWGHVDHMGVAVVHQTERGLTFMQSQLVILPVPVIRPPVPPVSRVNPVSPVQSSDGDVLLGGNTVGVPGVSSVTGEHSVYVSSPDGVPSVRPGSVPFVSDRTVAYGWLLLATHEHMMTGGLSACDWFTPVTRGVWRAAAPISIVEHVDVI